MLQLLTGELTFTFYTRKTCGPTFRLAHLSLDVLLGAIHAEEVHVLATTANHAIEWILCETTLAFTHLIVHPCLPEVSFLSSLCLLCFTAFDWLA